MTPLRELVVRGARVHNLRNVDVRLPHDALVVVTGPSGSGKSSLALHTIFAEGQRRYVESLSAHARRFLQQLPKPDVDLIEGLRPALSVPQRSPSRNPRSTVATATEISDHLRVLYARAGVPHCPVCDEALRASSAQDVVEQLLTLDEGTRLTLLAPVLRGGSEVALGEWIERLRREGYVRVRLDGVATELGELHTPSAGARSAQPRSLSVVIDRVVVKTGVRARVAEAVELAYALAGGVLDVETSTRGPDLEVHARRFHEALTCSKGHPSVPELSPQLFSFNSPVGACPRCDGLGEVRSWDAARVVPDPTLSLREGAIAAWGKPGGALHREQLERVGALRGVDLDKPFAALSEKARSAVLMGQAPTAKREGYEGVFPSLERRATDYGARKAGEGGDPDRIFDYLEREIGRFASYERCPECLGGRLCAAARGVRVAGLGIVPLLSLGVRDARAHFADLTLPESSHAVADRLLGELRARLAFLDEVGLGYLSLARSMATLSGGEAQRVRLATQIGAALSGVLYVLDEPTVGLHASDVARLLGTLRALRDRGNTVLLVEHDEAVIRAADHLVDMGPGAGREGGRVLSEGPLSVLLADPRSPTGRALRPRGDVDQQPRRPPAVSHVRVQGATLHNLGGVDVSIPLGRLVCVSGVSGSGKSSLITHTLVPKARELLNGAHPVAVQAELTGLAQLDKLVQIDQSPIGRTPRSNPASYVGILADLRELFAGLPEARARGYASARFSFNTKGGRCDACAGEGVTRVSMHFLPDVEVTCAVCSGTRFNRETLEVRYRGASFADVLAMDVGAAADFFAAHPRIAPVLDTMRRMGLAHLALGRSGTTLSGGEAQRVKLARELSKRGTGRTLYVLDEPTTGLHFGDVDVLLGLLDELVDAGNSVVVIEHDLRVIRAADHVIDLGPGGGRDGGRVVYEGAPAGLTSCSQSATGQALRRTDESGSSGLVESFQ
ncbi:MAG: excinuclease ABC subunit UvrA [Sandaracinaceae bacterium]|nr:excinuclease ABC subunit UvrA [Myxococcales bacterium]MCB9658584.1 excinuclease ABC subunit UvrA [Sandaracinaceae bacterium]